MKIIFFDKNKELCEMAKTIPEIEVKNCDLSKIKADAISTASNPNFTFGGGIDAILKERFNLKKGEWLEIQKGDDKIKNVVLNITVDNELITSKELIRKAYINFFNVAKNEGWETVAVCGFGSGIGSLPNSTVIEALREAVDMYLTITNQGKLKVEIIGVNNLKLDKIDNLKITECGYATITECGYATITECGYATITSCWYAKITVCWYATITECGYAKITACGTAKITECENAIITKCWVAKITECGSTKITECGYATITACWNAKITECENATITACGYAKITECGDSTITECWVAKITACGDSTITECWVAKITECGSATITACENATITECEYAKITACWNIIALYSSGTADKVFFADKHKSEFEITNPYKKTDYKKCFLNKFKEKSDGKYYAYKFLTPEWESPINSLKLKYEVGKEIEEKCDKNVKEECSCGINLASLSWCKRNNNDKNNIYVKFEFDIKNAVVPNNSDGKFRVSKCLCVGKI